MLLHALIAINILLTPVDLPIDDLPQLDATTPKMTRIYLIRHGESAFNIPDSNGVMFTSGKGISVPLTETGKQQARILGSKLKGKLKDAPYIILSSTALRAEETADLLFEELKSQSIIERGGSYEELCELGQGIWEGKPKDHAYENEMDIWNKRSAKDKFIVSKLSTAESYQEVAKRFISGLQDIVDTYPNKTLLIATHYAAMNALALQLNPYIEGLSEEEGSPLPTLPLKNCDMLLIEVEQGNSIDQAKVRMHIKSGV